MRHKRRFCLLRARLFLLWQHYRRDTLRNAHIVGLRRNRGKASSSMLYYWTLPDVMGIDRRSASHIIFRPQAGQEACCATLGIFLEAESFYGLEEQGRLSPGQITSPTSRYMQPHMSEPVTYYYMKSLRDGRPYQARS